MWRGASGKSFAVKEWFERATARPRLVVVSTAELPVEPFWTVELTGTLATVSAGSEQQRVLIVTPASVYVLCDSRGRPTRFVPVKGLDALHWPKRQLIELTGAARTDAVSDTALPSMPDPPAVLDSLTVAAGSRDSLKWLPDGVPVSINGAIVSAVYDYPGYSYDFFYVEKIDRSFGIWMSAPVSVYPGDAVDVKGWLLTGAGGAERLVLVDPLDPVVVQGRGYPLPPELGLSNKTLGGGCVGEYTPSVPYDPDASKAGTGTNNTGLLVKVWGKVTGVDPDSGWIYYIDDGSGVTADTDRLGTRHVGVKVYDPCGYYPHPGVGNFYIVTGISTAEFPYGESSSIRTIWTAEPVMRWTIPGSGTVSGDVTAADAGAHGGTVTIFSALGSTTATFNGTVAHYSNLRLPAGEATITASVLGYKSASQWVTVYDGMDTTADFSLEALARVVDVVASPPRMLPGGGDVTITVIVREEEGRRFGNEPVTWNTDVPPERIVTADSSTDAVGEARMVIHSAAASQTDTVSATVAGVTGRCYPEWTSADAPTIHVVSPGSGDTVSGEVKIAFESWDEYGAQPGVRSVVVFLDGQELSYFPGVTFDLYWCSNEHANGTHRITAVARDADGNAAQSNTVVFTTDNLICELSVSPSTVGTNSPVTISAVLSAPYDWQVSVVDMDGQTVWSTTGTGSAVSVVWPGGSEGGLYTVSISVDAGEGSSESSVSSAVAVNEGGFAQVLLVAEQKDFWRYKGFLEDIAKITKSKGLSTRILLPDDATWENIKPVLSSEGCLHFLIYCHGEYRGGPEANVTYLLIAASKHVLYSHRWSEAPQPGEPDPDPDRPGWKVAYAREELSRADNPPRLAWIEACRAGRIGGDRSKDEEDPDWGKYGRYSCYERKTMDWNDMATGLGITAEAALTRRCGYVGYYEVGVSIDKYVGGSGIPGMTVRAWSLMADGRTFEQARSWIDENPEGRFYKVPKPDKPNWQCPLVEESAPFYNWRFWGNTNVSLF